MLMVHGFLDSSFGYTFLGPNKALPYLLVDQNYDVWLANVRGNRYSRKHKKLNPKFRKFWNFSWHEIGVYDIPEIIDYILKETGQKKLHYIGHSQGTTVFFVMCSEKPEYNKKIISMNALAPVTYSGHVRSRFLRLFLPFINTIDVRHSNELKKK